MTQPQPQPIPRCDPNAEWTDSESADRYRIAIHHGLELIEKLQKDLTILHTDYHTMLEKGVGDCGGDSGIDPEKLMLDMRAICDVDQMTSHIHGLYAHSDQPALSIGLIRGLIIATRNTIWNSFADYYDAYKKFTSNDAPMKDTSPAEGLDAAEWMARIFGKKGRDNG